MLKGREVIAEIRGANPTFPEYPLLPGDLLMQTSKGDFYKVAPGLAVGGFVLDESELALSTRVAKFQQVGPFDYRLAEEHARRPLSDVLTCEVR
jgi:hypothetical protein